MLYSLVLIVCAASQCDSHIVDENLSFEDCAELVQLAEPKQPEIASLECEPMVADDWPTIGAASYSF